jgi:beta-phosphoglucomutase-like phosphatase (HAD superfamily)
MSSVERPKLFLDLDGTLLDIEAKYCALYREAKDRYGLKILSPQVYWQNRRKKLSEREILLLSNPAGSALDNYINYWRRNIEAKQYLSLDKLSITRQTLIHLVQRYDLYVVTMRQRKANLLWQLRTLGLTRYLTSVACRADLPLSMRQSNEVIAKTALISRFKTSPRRDVLVGDTELEGAVGDGLRLRTYLISSGIRSRASLGAMASSKIRVFTSLNSVARFLL